MVVSLFGMSGHGIAPVTSLFDADFKPLIDGLRHGPNRTICASVALTRLTALDKRERLLTRIKGLERIA